MARIEIGSFALEWGRGRKIKYPNTPELYPSYLMNNGKPEILDITNDNAFQMFITTPEVYSVIQRRGYLLSSGAWKHYTTKGDKLIEVKNSDVVNLLENPNPLVNGNDFLRQWSENSLVNGNNYMYQLRGTSFDEIPGGLTNLTANNIRIKTTGKLWDQTKIEGIIQYYEYLYGDSNTNSHKFEPNEIIHSKMLNSENPIKGNSPLIPLNMEISNIRAAKKFRNVIMSKNGALGMLTPKSTTGQGAIPLTSDERKRVELEYQKQYGSKDNQSKILMAQTALEWVAMTYPTKDLMLFEEVTADFMMIIDSFGLNDNLFSKEKGSTYANLSTGLKHAYQTTVIPDSEEKAMQISKAFNLIEKGEFLVLDYSKIPALQENQKELSERLEKVANAVSTLQQSTIYSNEEIRAIAASALQI